MARTTRFWGWFRQNAGRIESLYDRGNLEELSSMMNLQLDAVAPGLAWEVGPGKRMEYSLTISAEGNSKLRSIVNEILRRAPKIRGWEFYGFKQRRPAPRAINLPERGLRVSTENWQFVPEEDRRRGRIHVTVLDDQLAEIGKQAALRAVSLFLDALLGEETVEEWLGQISVAAQGGTKTKIHHISRLPDYILWATHREKDPLLKPDSR
jgi:hypothetical protein